MCGCHRSSGGSSAARIELTESTGRLTQPTLDVLTGWLRAAARELDVPGEVRVRIVADPEMSDLHLRHTGIAGPTDVLTFDLRDLGLGPLDVDIVVCLDEAIRQAAARGHPPERELLLYALHGILHCLGHDDHDEARYARMHAAEDAVLTAIGVGPVFDRPAKEGGAP